MTKLAWQDQAALSAGAATLGASAFRREGSALTVDDTLKRLWCIC